MKPISSCELSLLICKLPGTLISTYATQDLQLVQERLEGLIETLRQCIIIVEEFQPESQHVLNTKL